MLITPEEKSSKKRKKNPASPDGGEKPTIHGPLRPPRRSLSSATGTTVTGSLLAGPVLPAQPQPPEHAALLLPLQVRQARRIR
jgi:hypothetical protein